MISLGFKGEQRNLLVRQGADFEMVSIAYVDEAGAPIDLTNCEIRGAIKKAWNDSDVAAEVTFTIAPGFGGIFTFDINRAETAKLAAGTNESMLQSQYVWQADIIDATGKKVPLYWGNVSVFRDIGIS